MPRGRQAREGHSIQRRLIMTHTFIRRSRAIRWGLLSLALTVGACGDDDPTGPGGDADLVGTWDYSITAAGGAGFSSTCDVEDMTLTFTRSGEALQGTVTAGGDDSMVCGGTTLRDVNGTSPLEDITVDGSGVGFEFRGLSSPAMSALTPVVSTGTVSGNGNSMSGTVTFALLFPGTTLPVTGQWTATRR
jgi:hypothetical protein